MEIETSNPQSLHGRFEVAEKKRKETKPMSLMRQYVLTGAGLGLYFGWFFRPVREPSLLVVLGLSALAALVTMLFQLRGPERPSLQQWLVGLAKSYGRFVLALAILEGRHLAYDWGGRWAVIAVTTILGALAGAWWARDKERLENGG